MRKKKESGDKAESVNLITAIINLVITLINLIIVIKGH